MRVTGILAVAVAAALAAPAWADTATDAGAAPPPSSAAEDGADAAEPALPQVQLVQAWPKTRQALLYDQIHGNYVVVTVGQTVGRFRVTKIAKNQLLLAELGSQREYVLMPTPVAEGGQVHATTGSAATPGAPAPTTGTPAAPASPTAPGLLDPYPSGVLDPYGTEGVRVVQAPPDQRVTGTPAPPPGTATVGMAPTGPGAPATTTHPPGPGITRPAPAPVPPPTVHPAPPTAGHPAPPAGPRPGQPVTLSRSELDGALADFATLTRGSRLSLGATGVAFAHVARGSLFARVGLQNGDRVVSINGSPLRSVDDAADLYARLGTFDRLAIDVVRHGKHVTLHCTLVK